jgi:peptidyl-prolyl cis-trans isomerase SurA
MAGVALAALLIPPSAWAQAAPSVGQVDAASLQSMASPGGSTLPSVAAPAPTEAVSLPAAPDVSAPAAAESVIQPAQRRGLTEGVIALVNDEIISSYDLRQRMLLLIATSGVQPTEQNLPAIQQQALRSLVDEHLEMQEIKHWDVKVDEKEVEDEIDDIARENKITKLKLLGSLEAAGVNPKTLREQIKAQIGWRDLVGGRYGSRARVDDQEVQQTIQRIADSESKAQYLAGEIYIDAATVGGMDEAMNGARQLVDQISKGAPFPAVARQFSNDPTAASGGDAGWLISGEMDPNVEYALQQMHPGQLSLPIPSDKGVWIVYLRQKRAGGVSHVYHLAQAAIRLKPDATEADADAAKAKLAALAHSLTCKNYEAVAAKTPGVVAADLGEAAETELSPEFKSVADSLKVDEVSPPIRTEAGLHLLLLCGKRASGGDIPTKQQVEDRLYSQQISMLAQRSLRDLHNSATIETR